MLAHGCFPAGTYTGMFGGGEGPAAPGGGGQGRYSINPEAVDAASRNALRMFLAFYRQLPNMPAPPMPPVLLRKVMQLAFILL